MRKRTLKIKTILVSLIFTCIALTGCSKSDINNIQSYINDIASITSEIASESDTTTATDTSNTDIPEYTGDAYVEINNNEPTFTKDEITTTSFESVGFVDKFWTPFQTELKQILS